MSGINDQFKSASRTLSELVKKTTDVVGERWDELTGIQDRRREVWELARERKRLMAEMGAKVYSLHRRGKVQNRDLLSDCDRIDTIGSEISRLETEIEELKQSRSLSEPTPVEVTDESPVVGEDDIDTEAAEPAGAATAYEPPREIEPQVDKEGAMPCAHAHDPAEGPREGEENEPSVECAPEDEEPTMIPVEEEGIEPEVDKDGAEPCAHSRDPVEGPREGDDQDPDSPECER